VDARLTRIRELIDQKEAIDTELASLIGGLPDAPRRGRPKKGDTGNGNGNDTDAGTASGMAPSE
jgi:hypothetical protein